MQKYPLTSAPPPGPGPKNYVFVDEHNRHKRLKVMRACEGCRRRKIKCDSATTNTWPCAACVRLKLQCVPPAGGLEGEAGDLVPDGTVDQSVDSQYVSNPVGPAQQTHSFASAGPSFQLNQNDTFSSYEAYVANFQRPNFDLVDKSYGAYYPDSHQFAGASAGPYQPTTQAYDQGHHDPEVDQQEGATSSPVDPYTAEDLMDRLGDLRINENGVALYTRPETGQGQETNPPLQEIEPEPRIMAAFSTGAGSQIRIPPALMPSDDEAMDAFQIFFRDVHPYVPILNQRQFYDQWRHDRGSISPLVLEAVFANSGRLNDDPAEGAQWLALANKHEASFLDSPRLSTLQALLLLLKARESAPKRGYYYRSWMTCKTAVTMAKDLELHEHHETHSSGESCGSDPVDCLAKTRIWQTLLIIETMVGGPQGRSDFGVDPNSVDISPSPPCSDVDEFERATSRQFAYFVRNVRNIRLITDVAIKLKKKKDWGLDQAFVAHNAAFKKWPDELPKDLQVVLPQNGAPPTLPSHFVGNMHSHYHLALLLLHRPQLKASGPESPQWRHHMNVCYDSAKVLCRLQEAMLAQFELTGLLCMQRGINFTIYAILTCIMLHLVAISSPDPEYNTEARDYFVRHMRILERCVAAWPMPETEAQINALRAAFSADVNKPFELRDSFPLGSPSDQSRPSPTSQSSHERPPPGLADLQHPTQQQGFPPPGQQVNQLRGQQPTPYLVTPPVSAYSSDSKPHSPLYAQSYDLEQHQGFVTLPTPGGGFFHHPQTAAPSEFKWNPTPIMDRFDTAFAIPPSAFAPPPPHNMYGGGGGSGSSPPPGSMQSMQTSFASTSSPTYGVVSSSQNYPQQQQQQQYFAQQPQSFSDMSPPVVADMSQLPGASSSSAPGAYAGNAMFVTPRQWQQSVATVIDPSRYNKRRWDFEQQ